MKLEYDKRLDVAYFHLVTPVPGGAKKTYACDPDEVGGQIHLDFDGEGRLIGIEVLDASLMLPKQVLKAAQQPAIS